MKSLTFSLIVLTLATPAIKAQETKEPKRTIQSLSWGPNGTVTIANEPQEGASGLDEQGHGKHVAEIIAAQNEKKFEQGRSLIEGLLFLLTHTGVESEAKLKEISGSDQIAKEARDLGSAIQGSFRGYVLEVAKQRTGDDKFLASLRSTDQKFSEKITEFGGLNAPIGSIHDGVHEDAIRKERETIGLPDNDRFFYEGIVSIVASSNNDFRSTLEIMKVTQEESEKLSGLRIQLIQELRTGLLARSNADGKELERWKPLFEGKDQNLMENVIKFGRSIFNQTKPANDILKSKAPIENPFMMEATPSKEAKEILEKVEPKKENCK